MGDSSATSMFASPVTSLDVFRVIVALPNKSTSMQDVPIFIYKHCAHLLAPIIAEIFNMSIKCGVFPDCLKLARVVPIFKAGDPKLVGNYRPISVLSTMSKLFEKLMYDKLMCYVNATGVLSSHQYGFRKGRSTSDAILELLQQTYASLDERKILVGVFLDFTKAFDTVNHTILMEKLNHIGIRGPIWRWFKSYLSGREQYVRANNVHSNRLPIQLGIPQGSNLGPLLFNIYINDMSVCSNVLRFVHFADDTTVFLSGNGIEELSGEVNNALLDVNRWTTTNRLSLNTNKTSYMLFSDNSNQGDMEIRICEKSINRVREAKFLGVIIDDSLSFIPHVDALCRQVSRSIGALGRVSTIVPLTARLGIYYALVYSKIVYGVVAWGGTRLGNCRKVEALLKRAHKLLSCLETDFNPVSKLLNFKSIYEYFSVSKFYEILNSGYPTHFYDMLIELLPHHSHSTRFSSGYSFNFPLYNKAKCQKFFIYQSIMFWNNLPAYLKDVPSSKVFKRNLKEFLLSRQCCDTD